MRIAVIGGGPAGMMAAYAAATQGAEVMLIEQNEKLGKKLYITGKGRCNLTNTCETEDFFAQVVSNPKFLYSSIYGFPPKAVTEFFENRGCRLKTERGGRVFPQSDHSSDVIRTMERALKEAGVEIRLKTRLCGILTKEKTGAAVTADVGTGKKRSAADAATYAGTGKERSAADVTAYAGTGKEPSAADRAAATKGKSRDGKSTKGRDTKTGCVCGIRICKTDPLGGKDSGRYRIAGETQMLDVDAVILAGGGLSYPATGADGSLIGMAEELGHGITQLHPALVPLEVKEGACADLQGLSLKNVTVTLRIGKKKIYEGFGEMLFTHFGVSGPLILSASSLYSRKYADEEAVLSIDLKPALDTEQLDERLKRDFSENPNKEFHSILRGLAPGKLAEALPDFCGIPAEKKIRDITREERLRLRDTLKDLRFTVTGTRDFGEAIVTSGGISVKEIDPSTMESRRIRGLYFAGEMIDTDAFTGGYNLQIAWATGHLAGDSAAGATG